MSEWFKGLKQCENMIKYHESIKDGCIAAHDYFVRELSDVDCYDFMNGWHDCINHYEGMEMNLG